jgi:hypothetical protein
MSDEQPTPAEPDPTTRAAALLAALGDTETQVAATLKAAGITGRRGECGACPIAVYLLRSDLGCYDVAVDGSITMWFVGPDNIQHLETVPMTDAVNDFVASFDGRNGIPGRYDELVAGGEQR